MHIALCAGRATSASACALRSIQTWQWPSMQNRHRTVHPANAGEFGAHRQTRAESSRLCSMVAVLIVCEYICKHLSAVRICELVPYYAPRRWRIKGMRIHFEGKCIRIRIVLQILTIQSFGINYHRGRHLTALDAHH